MSRLLASLDSVHTDPVNRHFKSRPLFIIVLDKVPVTFCGDHTLLTPETFMNTF